MTQPSFVPIPKSAEVRPAYRLHVAASWSPDRPGDLRLPDVPVGRGFGKPGPDQGFALRVARAFAGQVVLTEGEHLEDVVTGCALLASRRASAFGRAPSAPDLRWAMNLWGFLEQSVPSGTVATRAWAFRSLVHDYAVQRALVDRVPEEALTLSPDEAVRQRDRWVSSR